MKKFRIFTIFALVVSAFVLTGCYTEKDPIILNEPDEQGTIVVANILLNETNLTLAKGQSYTLVATVKPDNATNKNVTWSTSNDSKVSVSTNGKVTAVATGDATITATAGGKTATCRVTVSESGTSEIAVQSITLDKISFDLFSGDVGRSFFISSNYFKMEDLSSLNATIMPENATNKTITWTSSNTSVIEITENNLGLGNIIYYVVVRGKGTATIAAKAGDKTATCTVNVLDVKLDKSKIELVVGEEYILNATTNPGGQPITWTSSNTSRATVEGSWGQGKVVVKSSGTLSINATYQGQTVSCNVIIYDVPLSGVTIEGVTWAARNVNTPGTFAEKVTDSGMFYQWNSKTGYSNGQFLNTYQTGTTWSSENDPSPSGWRLPTLDEAQKLLSNAILPYFTSNDKGRLAIVNGQECVVMKFENDQHLVFRSDHFSWYAYQGCYWTSTPSGGNDAYIHNRQYVSTSSRTNTLMLRCVKK